MPSRLYLVKHLRGILFANFNKGGYFSMFLLSCIRSPSEKWSVVKRREGAGWALV